MVTPLEEILAFASQNFRNFGWQASPVIIFKNERLFLK
jgi:hypothetical protein